MGAKGVQAIDFGAFPGKSDATVDVTGQSGFVATSSHEAWITPVATADHSADEHMVESIDAHSVYFADGTLRLRAFNTSQINENPPPGGQAGRGTRLYGLWSVGWVWE